MKYGNVLTRLYLQDVRENISRRVCFAVKRYFYVQNAKAQLPVELPGFLSVFSARAPCGMDTRDAS